MSKKIIVGSKNPVKLQAALQGFQEIFPTETFTVEGISVDSGVSDQPKTEKEFLQGAHKRAEEAMKAMADADYWVGLEGGVEDSDHGMECWAWMVVRSKNQIGIGSTGKFILPPKSAALIHEGMELGHATDFLHNKDNSKQDQGTTGVLTLGVMNRTRYYTHGIILALIPFIDPKIYE